MISRETEQNIGLILLMPVSAPAQLFLGGLLGQWVLLPMKKTMLDLHMGQLLFFNEWTMAIAGLIIIWSAIILIIACSKWYDRYQAQQPE